MARKHYRREHSQNSKASRAALRAARWAGLHHSVGHRSHIAWRKERAGHPLYKRLIARRIKLLKEWGL